MTNNPPRQQEEIAAALRASRELGPEYDEAMAASLVERVDDTIEERVKHHVARQAGANDTGSSRGLPANNVRMVLSLVCLGISIPSTAIGAAMAGAGGMFIVWAGLIAFYLISVSGLRR
ncbi:hypothetical protein GCM10007079_24540 [Nocardiopsis terrae]|uniref:Integral membrane protein n=1 Tax=Nocardiopsis terrae TaxID=372655 RepID=A0ABR9HFY6_9ACTN|nr:hypothetical protein [Nocardiopsis terrae]MBE1457939.1 hypothetical protein [Nocardiopsis terrae]GHC83398.1 hypothetical protein GCM10007079_24540 [Nocardiopsis terrae]